MRRILASRLPQRLSTFLPPAFVEFVVGLSTAGLMFLLRLPFTGYTGDQAPYAFNFVAVVFATVLAGWRSGAIALVVGQMLLWYFVVPVRYSFTITDPKQLASLILASVAQGFTLTVIWLYQREVDKGTAERERRLSILDDAMKEIDHRTRNNYQTVLAVIELQARRSTDEAVVKALLEVGDRIRAVADASQQLAVSSGGLTEVRLRDQLCGLVRQIAKGLARADVTVECDVDDVTASADTATSLAIIVNELVTNALKHAFAEDCPGHISVIGRAGAFFQLIVADDGQGIRKSKPDAGSGLGTRLVASFVTRLGAELKVRSSEQGTVQQIVVPSLT